MLNKWKQKKQESKTQTTTNDRLLAAKRNILGQSIGLAVFVVLVTVVLLFAATTAWYTNTITAGGLSFKAEAWGFDGTVSVSDAVIEAAPGDTGVVELRVKNKSDLASSIGVTISKEYMEEAQMQKRIYFYVDKSTVVNGESVDRIYLSNSDGYSYTLYGRNELILSETLHTDVLIKWEWVYDVVGYYFVGDVTEGENGATVTVEEYLRPIEYSYDDATYDKDGNLLTVDGEKDLAAFLAEITANDGYTGVYSGDINNLTYNEKSVTVDSSNCFPIDEENGVWAYFCTKNEIDTNTVWDTMYASTAENDKKSYQARISVTGEQLNQEIITLDAEADIATALSENSGDIVRLSQNITIGETISVGSVAAEGEEAQYVNAILDLNGFNVAATDTSLATLFDVAEGSSLTVYNGNITGVEGNKVIAVKTIGGEVTLNEVKMTGISTGVRIEDNSGNGTNSTVIVSDCQFNTVGCTIIINGDGELSDAMTQLVVQDSVITSETYAGIIGNGNSGANGTWGTSIQITNSTVEGYYCSIYHPQSNSFLTIDSSTLKGITGLVIKGGHVSVNDSVVEGTAETGNRLIVDPETVENLGLSGSLDTGDGIYIESNYNKPISLIVSGDSDIKHHAETARAVRVYPECDHVTVELLGGTYSSDVSSFVDEDHTCTASDVEVTEGETTVTKTVYIVEEKETETEAVTEAN